MRKVPDDAIVARCRGQRPVAAVPHLATAAAPLTVGRASGKGPLPLVDPCGGSREKRQTVPRVDGLSDGAIRAYAVRAVQVWK